MSRVKYNFDGYSEEAAKKSFAEHYDSQIFKVIKDAATVYPLDHENIIDNLRKAIAILNTPDYFLVSNPVHKDQLEPWVKEEELKVKVLYYGQLEENKFLLVKNGAARMEVYYPENSFIGMRYEPKVVNPAEIRLYVAK